MYDYIQTIRYMGNKNKLLEFIIPEIEKITNKGEVVCDLMAGTNSVGYALKKNYTVISNDVQAYSYYIGKALIENNGSFISSELAVKNLQDSYKSNLAEKNYSFFYSTYKDTYFSEKQCLDIDSIRCAIDNYNGDEYTKALYLTALMSAMCKVQSTPGHFAQFLDKDSKRVQPLRSMNLWEEFLLKCDSFESLVFTDYSNKCYCMDYNRLLDKKELISNVKTFYLDSPYSQEQYSRFYHILETLVKYDSPVVKYKAKYRTDRFMSDFCYKDRAENEFYKIIKACYENKSNLVISYSNKGVVPVERLETLANELYNNVEIKLNSYKHSTQGKGNKNVQEVLFILKY